MKSKYIEATKNNGRPKPEIKLLPARDEIYEQEQNITEVAWDLFVSLLKRKDSRITKARRIIFQRVFERHDHFRADDLAADLAQGSDRVSRGTVYRTLALLVQAGLVQEVRDLDIHVHYEHVFGHHHHGHMICDRCGRFFEFSDPDIKAHIDKICRSNKFNERIHRLVIFGTCKECNSNNDNKPDSKKGNYK